jgi:hypothetical protein
VTDIPWTLPHIDHRYTTSLTVDTDTNITVGQGGCRVDLLNTIIWQRGFIASFADGESAGARRRARKLEEGL